MLTGEIRNQVDRVWDTFWSGGISNPLEHIDHLTNNGTIDPGLPYEQPFTDLHFGGAGGGLRRKAGR